MPGARLTFEDRKVIERCHDAGMDIAEIATAVDKHPTTIVRELNGNSGTRANRPPTLKVVGVNAKGGWRPKYRAEVAQQRATESARRPKKGKLVGTLAAVVALLLRLDWSPQQISAKLPQMFPDEDGMRVSHETIYQSLFVQSRGELRRELTKHLRTGRTARKPQGSSEKRGKLVGMVPISARPAEADDRAVPGHWEGDLILGAVGQGAVITLVERTTRFVLLAPLPDTHKAIDLREVLTPLIASLPEALRRSLTWDQGKEMAEHAAISIAADVAIFFADPHSPWQRGSNENTNGLLRQYWPKGSDLRGLTQADCDIVADRLNSRPRQTLGWQTPRQALTRALSATAA